MKLMPMCHWCRVLSTIRGCDGRHSNTCIGFDVHHIFNYDLNYDVIGSHSDDNNIVLGYHSLVGAIIT